MAFELRENSGSLFKNDRKEQPNHPDYKGTCKVNGQVMDIAAWVKETKAGAKFFSFSFKPSQRQQAKEPDPWDQI